MKANKSMKVLSYDMGKTYSGWSLIDSSCVIHRSGLIQHPVDCMIFPTFNQQVVEFTVEINEILHLCDLNKDNGDVIVFERLMTRPGRGCGGVVEVCNFMLGIISQLTSVSMIPVCACTWKNFYKRKFGTNVSSDLLNFLKLGTMHECDSILMGCHHLIKNSSASEDIHTKIMLSTDYVSYGSDIKKPVKKKSLKKIKG